MQGLDQLLGNFLNLCFWEGVVVLKDLEQLPLKKSDATTDAHNANNNENSTWRRAEEEEEEEETPQNTQCARS